MFRSTPVILFSKSSMTFLGCFDPICLIFDSEKNIPCGDLTNTTTKTQTPVHTTCAFSWLHWQAVILFSSANLLIQPVHYWLWKFERMLALVLLLNNRSELIVTYLPSIKVKSMELYQSRAEISSVITLATNVYLINEWCIGCLFMLAPWHLSHVTFWKQDYIS